MGRDFLSGFKKLLKQRKAMAGLRRLGAAGIVAEVRSKRLTYLNDFKIYNIVQSLADLDRKGLEGDCLEAGCALGGSSAVIAAQMGVGRKLFVHDVFGMIPAPSENDPEEVHERYKTIVEGKAQGLGNGADTYYGYVHNLKDVVRENLSACLAADQLARTELVEGLVEDTLVGDTPIAFAHIDVDWYDPVKVCLERIEPRMPVGGIFILDDYFDWESCKRAVDEFLTARPGRYEKNVRWGNLSLTKIA